MGAYDFNTDVQVLLICAGVLTVLVYGTYLITKRIRREQPEPEVQPEVEVVEPEPRRTNPECARRSHALAVRADGRGVMRWVCLRDGCDETWDRWPGTRQSEPFDQERAS